MLRTTAVCLGRYMSGCWPGEGFLGHVVSLLHVVWILAGTHRIHLNAWLLVTPSHHLHNRKGSHTHIMHSQTHVLELCYRKCSVGNLHPVLHPSDVKLSYQSCEQQMARPLGIQLSYRRKFTSQTNERKGQNTTADTRVQFQTWCVWLGEQWSLQDWEAVRDHVTICCAVSTKAVWISVYL